MSAANAQSVGEGYPDVRGTRAFEAALQVVTQDLTRMQETLDQQCQDVLCQYEQRMQEVLHLQVQKLQSEFRQEMQEAQRQHEQRMMEILQTQERKLQIDYRQYMREVQQQYERNVQEALRRQEQRIQDDFQLQLQAVMLTNSQGSQQGLDGVGVQRSASGREQDKKQLEARMQKRESYAEKPTGLDPRLSSSTNVSSSPSPSSTNLTTSTVPGLVPEALKDLEQAVGKGKVDDVRRLLDMGVDVNTRVDDGQTLLMLAAKEAHPSVVALLLERNADVHAATTNGNTALQFAAHSDRSGRCVALLVGAGANVNSRDAKGFMPLHRAVSSENEAAVRALLKAGASRTAKDHINLNTPIEYAKNKSIRQLLEF